MTLINLAALDAMRGLRTSHVKEVADQSLSLAVTFLQCSFTEAAVGGPCSALHQADDRLADPADVQLSGANGWYLQFATAGRVPGVATGGYCECKRESGTEEEAAVQANRF